MYIVTEDYTCSLWLDALWILLFETIMYTCTLQLCTYYMGIWETILVSEDVQSSMQLQA